MEIWRTWLARLFGIGCIALGVIGLIVGFKEVTWKLVARRLFHRWDFVGCGCPRADAG